MMLLYTFVLLGIFLLVITGVHYAITVAAPMPPNFSLMRMKRKSAEPGYDKPSVSFSLDPAYYTIPRRAHLYDAGLDLSPAADTKISPGCICAVDTRIRIAIPKGYVGLLCLRSGFAVDNPGLRLVNSVGIIDSGYTGNIKAAVENVGVKDCVIRCGTRFAQLVIVPCLLGSPQFVENLENTERGDGGFGSTGK